MQYLALGGGVLAVWYLLTGVAFAIEDYKKGRGSEYFADWVAGYGVVARLGVLGRVLFWPPIAKAHSGFWGLNDDDDAFPNLLQITAGTMLSYPCEGTLRLLKTVWAWVLYLRPRLVP